MDAADVTIRAIESVGPDTVVVNLETPDGFDAQPGQFVKLTATVDGEHVSRFYTLSSPDVGETFELTIGIDPDGTLGPWIEESEDEQVRIEGPYGTAFYENEPSSLILAGGPGIGPAIGIGERALADGNDVAIVYRDDEPVHRTRLDALADRGVTVVVTADPIDDAVREHHTGDEQVFVYGFQPFVTEALEALEAAGGDPDAAKVENFG